MTTTSLRRIAAALLLVACGFTKAYTQKFWLTTYEFPGGPKTGIAAIGDSCLVAGLTNGVLRSFNEGLSWEKILDAGAVYTVFATKEGEVLAGGTGKIYVSTDYGSTWDSVALNHNYPVTQFVRNEAGELFAITGAYDFLLGYVGAGMFYSGDHGATWVQRNNGLGTYLSCNKIAVDRNDRLYLMVADELVDGQGGLFISGNNGLQWEHIDIRIDGQGVIDDGIDVQYCTGLDISPQDSVYLSIEGVAVNVSTRLNLRKHIDDVPDISKKWSRMKVGNSISWWLDRLLNGIHFSANGDRYSSVSGSPVIGGTYFSKNEGNTWSKQQQGLGFDIFGRFGAQTFAEKSSGKIFMVQYLDERIYWADTSLVTGVKNPFPDGQKRYSAFPNPVASGEKIQLDFEQAGSVKTVMVFDNSGKMTATYHTGQQTLELEAPRSPGIYLIRVAEPGGGGGVARLIVR
jgi:photosystem II stability/assembly factor-like uncharacterized protein